MTEPLHVERLRAWLAARGGRVELLGWPRLAAGGEARGVRIVPREARARAVFAHATGNDAWFPQVALFKSLVASGVEVLAFDLDGHGRASTTVLAEKQLAGALADAVRASGWRDAHLIGQSLGAALCLHAVATGAVQAASLTLATMPLRVAVGARAALAELASPLRRAWWRQVGDYGAWGIVPAFGAFKRGAYPVRLAAGTPGGYVDVVARLVSEWRLEAAAAEVRCPTLLVSGGRDLIAPRADADRLVAAMHDARHLVAEGETHFTALLRADVCDAIARFIAG